MIIFRGIKAFKGDYFGYNRLFERFGFIQGLFGLFNQLLLLFIVIEKSTSVLAALVTKLPVRGGWVDVHPVHLQKLPEGDLIGIIGDLHHLGMAGGAGRYLLIVWVLGMPATVSGNC